MEIVIIYTRPNGEQHVMKTGDLQLAHDVLAKLESDGCKIDFTSDVLKMA